MRSRRRTFWPASSSATTAPANQVRDRWTTTGGFSRPALETELRNQLKQRADAESIRVFAENLRASFCLPRPSALRTSSPWTPVSAPTAKNRLPQP